MKSSLLLVVLAAMGCSDPNSAGASAGAGGAAGAATSSSSAVTSAGGNGSGGAAAGVLELGITVHLENHAPYDQTYLDRLRAYGNLFKDHGAKLTLEPRQEMWTAVKGANAALFSDLEAQGHSFGVHAALGSVDSYQQFVNTLTALRKELAGKDITVEQVSGQCQNFDWVTGSVEAGYVAMTGGTENCLLALAPENRPAGYENLNCPKATDCHDVYPQETEKKLHPWRAKDGSDWLTDNPDGKLVILPSNGTLPCLEEEAESPGMLTSCTFTQADIDLSKEQSDAALAVIDPSKINQLYFVWSFGLELSDELLETWFAMLEPYIADGRIVWKTQEEVYADYLAWEATNR